MKCRDRETDRTETVKLLGTAREFEAAQRNETAVTEIIETAKTVEREMKDRVCEFECNIDDMTAEELAFAAERLMEEGAKDVTLDSIMMKKGRPATLMTVMCADDEAEKERMIGLIFRYTSTIGIREVVSERYILDRTERTVETSFGPVRCKEVSGYGVSRFKLEYEDLARIARGRDISIAEARSLVMSEIRGMRGNHDGSGG